MSKPMKREGVWSEEFEHNVHLSREKESEVPVLCTGVHMPSCLRGGQQWWCHMFNKGLYFNLESTLET